ncbi:MAG: metal-sensitive transcriptional regulator [Chloroflexi bacterium]|nr:metal-sensitive transcriptional regulator [Chloroflexota bacterium]
MTTNAVSPNQEHSENHTPSPSELSDAKRNALKRLKYIEGHLGGIRRMIEQDTYCVDVLKQTFAVRRAIQKLESVLLEGHLHSCVIERVKDGREEDVLGELLELYSLADKR